MPVDSAVVHWNSRQGQGVVPDRDRVTPGWAATGHEPKALPDTTLAESHSREDAENQAGQVLVGVSVENDLRWVAAIGNRQRNASAPDRGPVGSRNADESQAVE